MLNKWTLFFAQVFSHAGLVYLIFVGNWQDWSICLLVYFFTGCLGMTVTYHRGLSHKAWAMPKLFEYVGTVCASIGLTGSAISWVAIHRKHHAFTDTIKDPHSPSHKGFFFCQWLSMFIPVEVKYVPDLLRRPFYKFQHKFYFLISFVYAGVLFSIDPFLIVSAWLAPATILWNAGSFIVTLAHLGEKSLETKSGLSKNSPLLALLVWGEGWHKNHHLKPESPSFGKYWWQFDLGYYIILLVEFIGGIKPRLKKAS